MASINRVLYIGITNNTIRRIEGHKADLVEGFSKRYKCHKLVYYEYFRHVKDAIAREKELKGWGRSKKIKLIEETNPNWQDLYEGLKES